METNRIFAIIAGVIILAGAGFFLFKERARPPAPKPGIIIETPKENDLVAFPLSIKGRVTGEDNWIAFEGHAGTVQAFDGQGPLSEIGALQISDDWTILPAAFAVSLGTEDNVSKIKADTGWLLFKNENPGGEPALNREFRLPVRYK